MFDIEKLIHEVQRHDCLWNIGLKSYNDKEKKADTWAKITKEMYDDWETYTPLELSKAGQEIQKKWKNVKDYFIKELRHQHHKKTGVRGSKRHKYIYFDMLLFLLPVYANKCYRSVPDAEPEYNEEYAGNFVEVSLDAAEIVDSKKNISLTEFVDMARSSNTQSTAHVEESTKNATQTEYVDTARSSNAITQISSTENKPRKESSVEDLLSVKFEEIDADKAFLISLLPTLKQFDDTQKLDFRIEVLKIIKKIKQSGDPLSN